MLETHFSYGMNAVSIRYLCLIYSQSVLMMLRATLFAVHAALLRSHSICFRLIRLLSKLLA